MRVRMVGLMARSNRRKRRFSSRRATRKLAAAGGPRFLDLLYRDPDRPITLMCSRSDAIARALMEDLRRLGAVVQGEKDVYAVVLFGRDL